VALPVASEPVLPVDSSYPIACELRLVRLSDGKVLVQRSRLQSVRMLPQLVSEMVSDLVVAMDGDAEKIVIISLGNRRQTPMGKALAKELTDQITTQMNRATRRTVYSVDLRNILLNESEIERATHLMTHPEVRKRIAGAQYAIQGGVAICGPETKIATPLDDTNDQ
jgi:curli biogenesis system outer membrane secretion channel CsgG